MKCQISDTKEFPVEGVPGIGDAAAVSPATHQSIYAAQPWFLAAVPATKESVAHVFSHDFCCAYNDLTFHY